MEEVKRKNLLTWILLTGLLTGTIDALLAIIISYKIPAATIFKFIASGVFGMAAFGPNAEMIYYGILFHYCIAFAWATTFFLLYDKLLSILKIRSVLILVTGLIIWVIMNLVVVPLSHTPPQPFHIIRVIEGFAALLLAFGVPVTVIADKFYSTTSASLHE
ncbi:hypothetical protein [Mucilaginibacter sp.]|uniref:hypothetical protein n=1 Tax=Mucilaginibacter sp. TaxID=1882438 RepID=UPI002637D603|nr:hypothetical protein [Mucilaginibacter sp.]MDB4922452.1 hypothetical protein [Mucilaginibacter sp.]